jgi:hypothetical protein
VLRNSATLNFSNHHQHQEQLRQQQQQQQMLPPPPPPLPQQQPYAQKHQQAQYHRQHQLQQRLPQHESTRDWGEPTDHRARSMSTCDVDTLHTEQQQYHAYSGAPTAVQETPPAATWRHDLAPAIAIKVLETPTNSVPAKSASDPAAVQAAAGASVVDRFGAVLGVAEELEHRAVPHCVAAFGFGGQLVTSFPQVGAPDPPPHCEHATQCKVQSIVWMEISQLCSGY